MNKLSTIVKNQAQASILVGPPNIFAGPLWRETFWIFFQNGAFWCTLYFWGTAPPNVEGPGVAYPLPHPFDGPVKTSPVRRNFRLQANPFKRQTPVTTRRLSNSFKRLSRPSTTFSIAYQCKQTILVVVLSYERNFFHCRLSKFLTPTANSRPRGTLASVHRVHLKLNGTCTDSSFAHKYE